MHQSPGFYQQKMNPLSLKVQNRVVPCIFKTIISITVSFCQRLCMVPYECGNI